jgi:two-component system, NarL family, invasion response regulator UvrY
MLRVLIVDDHVLIRCGLKQILQSEFGKDITIGEAKNSKEALEHVAKSKWDVAVVDINLPGRSGLLVLGDIKAMSPRLPVLILTACSEEEFAVRVLKAGASGFIPKESTHLELVQAIKTVLAGGKHVSNAAALMLITQLNAPETKEPHEILSDREYQVMCMFGKGKTPTEIAKELSLSVKTVSTYRTRILEKLNLRTNAQIIHYAVTHALVGP